VPVPALSIGFGTALVLVKPCRGIHREENSP
jgi:hypothetical protein